MENKVKGGVFGSGSIDRRKTIPEGIIHAVHAQLIAVCEVDQKVNIDIARELKVTPARTIDELLNSIYRCCLCCIADKYASLACYPMCKTKKRILCKKPFGLTVYEAEKNVSVSKNAGIFLGIGLMMRFLSPHQVPLKLIKEGKLDNLVYGRAQLLCRYPPIKGAWRQEPEIGGDGSLIDTGSHWIDLLMMFFGKVKCVL